MLRKIVLAGEATRAELAASYGLSAGTVSPERVTSALSDAVAILLKAHPGPGASLAGIGLGAPGIVEITADGATRIYAEGHVLLGELVVQPLSERVTGEALQQGRLGAEPGKRPGRVVRRAARPRVYLAAAADDKVNERLTGHDNHGISPLALGRVHDREDFSAS